MIKITTDHPKSILGTPVILSTHNGELLDYPRGMKIALFFIGWSKKELAVKSGYKSERSLEVFLQGRKNPPAKVLNVLKQGLEEYEKKTILSQEKVDTPPGTMKDSFH